MTPTVLDAGVPDGSTRDQILTVASNMFAIHGYHGTTTREIADGVGIRQPSLFHHFASKAAIMEALLEADLERAVTAAERIARSSDTAAVRLYRYLMQDVSHVASSKYNLAGVYTEEVRTSPEFEAWHRRRRRLHRAIERIVRDGVDSGAFVPFPAPFVREAILGIIGRTLASYSGGQAAFDQSIAEQVSSFVLRGLLVDTGQIELIRAEV